MKLVKKTITKDDFLQEGAFSKKIGKITIESCFFNKISAKEFLDFLKNIELVDSFNFTNNTFDKKNFSYGERCDMLQENTLICDDDDLTKEDYSVFLSEVLHTISHKKLIKLKIIDNNAIFNTEKINFDSINFDSVTDVDFSCMQISSESEIENLSKFLLKFNKIEELNLHNFFSKKAELKNVNNFFESLALLINLKKINISNNHLTCDKGLKSLQSIVCNLKNLKEIDVTCNNFKGIGLDLAQSLLSLSNLEKITMKNINLTSLEIAKIIKQLLDYKSVKTIIANSNIIDFNDFSDNLKQENVINKTLFISIKMCDDAKYKDFVEKNNLSKQITISKSEFKIR